MNDTKTKTVFEEPDELRRENDQLRVRLAAEEILTRNAHNKLAATEEALAQVQRESAELRAKYEAAQRLCLVALSWQGNGSKTVSDLHRAIRQYRLTLDASALSPSKQAAIDRGIAKAEKVGERWEKN